MFIRRTELGGVMAFASNGLRAGISSDQQK